MFGLGVPELLILLAVLLLIFGATRLPKLARSMGQAGKEMKAGFKEGSDLPEGPCPFCGTALESDTKFCPGCGKSHEDIASEMDRRKSA